MGGGGVRVVGVYFCYSSVFDIKKMRHVLTIVTKTVSTGRRIAVLALSGPRRRSLGVCRLKREGVHFHCVDLPPVKG